MRTKPLKRIYIGLVALLLVLAYPFSVVFAENTSTNNSTPTTSTTPQTASPPTSTPEGPTGLDASTYHYNQTTNEWENDYYIWNPTTRTTRPKQPLTYSYNPTTGKWDTTEWRYDSAAAKYEPNTVSVDQPPEGSPRIGQPQPISEPAPATIAVDAHAQPTTASQEQNDGRFDGFYNANISNTLTSTAQSGDAAVTDNTVGGNAITGDTTAISTIFNLLQSSTSLANGSPYTTFVSNIDGDVVGDFYIDPTMLHSLQPAGVAASAMPNIQVNNTTDNAINNTITLDAQSGNATVSENTLGGNATTGNANGVANLVNLLNSSVTAGQSFVGFLNIHGNLTGDVLLPPETLNTLLSAGTAPPPNSPLHVDDSNSGTINNLVHNQATTGSASVTNNTAAGDAKSGRAQTNLTVLDLTRHEIIGGNALLVFVNVLGNWIGAIVDAPTGSTSAALGGGITKNETPTNNIHLTNNNTITNTVDVQALSGDAVVDSNTAAGDAKSGNATASANIANIIGSNLSLSDWFGILFINVFGTWNGSFGIDTPAGNPIKTAAPEQTAQTPITTTVFRFKPKNNNIKQKPLPIPAAQNFVATATTDDDNQSAILSASTGGNDSMTPSAGERYNLGFAATAVVLGSTLIGIERTLAFRESRRIRQP